MPFPSVKIELLVHAVPAASLAGRRLSAKLRSPEYSRLEHAQDYEACLGLLYLGLAGHAAHRYVRYYKWWSGPCEL